MQLSPHFTLEELVRSDTAARLGIDNTPGPGALANLKDLAEKLERVRAILGAPMAISSGFRCLALNRAIGSRDTSAHVLGLAVDFTADKFGSPLAVAQRLADRKAEIGFDQLIHEYRKWVHLGFRVGQPRGELLTIDARGTVVGLVA